MPRRDPIDWPSIELHYRAGTRALRDIGQEFGCTHAAIRKRAIRDRWTRDLQGKVHELADEMVAQVAVSKVSRAEAEHQRIRSDAAAETQVRLAHRRDIAKARALVRWLWNELDDWLERGRCPEAAGDASIERAPASPGPIRRSTSTPPPVHVARDLIEAMHRLIQLERQAFGLNQAGGPGLPTVVVKDFTGNSCLSSSASPTARGQGASRQV